MVGPWDFRTQDIRLGFYLWHGEMDANAPLAMGATWRRPFRTAEPSFTPAMAIYESSLTGWRLLQHKRPRGLVSPIGKSPGKH